MDGVAFSFLRFNIHSTSCSPWGCLDIEDGLRSGPITKFWGLGAYSGQDQGHSLGAFLFYCIEQWHRTYFYNHCPPPILFPPILSFPRPSPLEEPTARAVAACSGPTPPRRKYHSPN